MTARWLDILSTADCHEFLRREVLGRVAVSIHALPVILPVIYRVTDRTVWFFTEEGTKLTAAVTNSIVAFEVDHLDATGGWSVLVVGRSYEETSSERIAALRADGLAAGAPGMRDHLIGIPIGQITGRSFVTSNQHAVTTMGYA
jgi:nitroimidazol reductase NimA-like FMN-containing flavoprotein (pyridoxamine 5'-phosphate oxidase superfamily)